MKRNNKMRFVSCMIAFVISVAMMPVTKVVEASTPTLGGAGKFAIFGGSTVTDTASSTVETGDVGVSPGTAITGFAAGMASERLHANTTDAQQAQTDLISAYNVLKGHPSKETLINELAGQTLLPGVYKFDSEAQLTGTLTLDANNNPNDLFIFQIGSSLITGSNSKVELIGGAQSGNIFWLVGSSATLNTNTEFHGTIIADQSITANSGTDVTGRLLACNTAVMLTGTTIRLPVYRLPVYETKPNAEIDYESESLTGFVDGATYYFNGATQTTTGTYLIEKAWMDDTELSIVKAGTGTNRDSEAQVLTIPARPAKPTIEGVNAKDAGSNNGIISGAGVSTEYRKDGDTSWTDHSGGDITGLGPATYEVRVKAVSGSAFASLPVEVIIYSDDVFKAMVETLIAKAEKLLVDHAGDIGDSDGKYPQAEVNKLKAAIVDAQKIVDEASYTQKTLKDLTDATDTFEKSKIIISFDVLVDSIKKGEGKQKDKTTKTTWDNLQTAIADGKSVQKQVPVTQIEVNNAANAIDAAIAALRYRSSGGSTSGSWSTTPDVITKETYIAQKGIISITKTGEIFSTVTENGGIYQPVYKVAVLGGAIYEIRAAENIFSLDGTLRYSKDTVVDTVTTGRNSGASKALYLGKFKVREIKAPYSMVLSDKVHEVELVHEGLRIDITETAMFFYNERQRVEINFDKSLEQDDALGIGMNGEIFYVTFGLFAARELRAADGTFIPKDGMIEFVSLDKYGHGVFKTDIPVGSELYLRELSTNASYALKDTKYPVVFEYGGHDKTFVIVTANDGKAISNDIIRYEIKDIETPLDAETPVDVETPDDEVTLIVPVKGYVYDTPRTGDDSILNLWLAIMGISAVSAAILGFVGFKKKKRTQL